MVWVIVTNLKIQSLSVWSQKSKGVAWVLSVFLLDQNNHKSLHKRQKIRFNLQGTVKVSYILWQDKLPSVGWVGGQNVIKVAKNVGVQKTHWTLYYLGNDIFFESQNKQFTVRLTDF